MSDAATFVKWLRERIEPSLERARTTDDPFTAWLVLEDVDDAFEGRAAMLWGAVISSQVPVLRRELIAPLAKHPLTRRLRTLSLANGVLRPNEVDLLLQHRTAFAHLERFDLSTNLLDNAAVEMLVREFPNAVFDDQREDYGEDEDRYVAVGE